MWGILLGKLGSISFGTYMKIGKWLLILLAAFAAYMWVYNKGADSRDKEVSDLSTQVQLREAQVQFLTKENTINKEIAVSINDITKMQEGVQKKLDNIKIKIVKVPVKELTVVKETGECTPSQQFTQTWKDLNQSLHPSQ